MFRARIFRGNSGPAQNMVSRLDETQNCASRLDETTGFDRHVPNLREGCLRQPAPAAARAIVKTGSLIISMSEPIMPGACLGNIYIYILYIYIYYMKYYTIYIIYYILYIMYYVLYSIYYILYMIYYIL